MAYLRQRALLRILDANEPGGLFRNYENNQKLKMKGIGGSRWALVQGPSLWQGDPNGAFNGDQECVLHSSPTRPAPAESRPHLDVRCILWAYLEEMKKALLW